MNVAAVICGVRLAAPIEPPLWAVQKNELPVSVRPTAGAGSARYVGVTCRPVPTVALLICDAPALIQ